MAGAGTDSHAGDPLTYVPLKALAETHGVLVLRLEEEDILHAAELHRLLNAYSAQIAMALERLRLLQQAQEARILKARHNLERSLLNSISHDLCTPLAAITGALSAVLEEGGKLNPAARAELLETALDTGDYSVHLADTGHAGLAAAVAVRPDAILLDLGLPDLDGMEVISGIAFFLPCSSRPAAFLRSCGPFHFFDSGPRRAAPRDVILTRSMVAGPNLHYRGRFLDDPGLLDHAFMRAAPEPHENISQPVHPSGFRLPLSVTRRH